MTRMRFAFACVLAAATAPALGCGGDDASDLCEPAQLEAALAAAPSGSTVQVGACRIHGSFLVPAGVSLEGAGPTQTIFESPSGRAALTLQPGPQASCAKNMSVTSAGPIGVLARGAGSACIEDVAVDASFGVGVGAESLDQLSLTRVTIHGTVTEANVTPAITSTMTLTWEDAPTHGLIIRQVRAAALTDVDVRGFARVGVSLIESTVTWTVGSASQNFAVGLGVQGGEATLSAVAIDDTFNSTRLLPGYGAVFTGGASITSDALHVAGTDGKGLYHDHANGVHTNAQLDHNRAGGVFAHAVSSLELSGTMQENSTEAVHVIDSSNVVIHDATIGHTHKTFQLRMGMPPIEVGDAIQLVNTFTGLHVRDVTLEENERVGVLIDLAGGSLDTGTLERVSVSASNDALGAIAQGGTIPADWDDAVTRTGAALANDMAFTGTLDSVGVIGPCDEPIPDPASAGLMALIGL